MNFWWVYLDFQQDELSKVIEEEEAMIKGKVNDMRAKSNEKK
jgi:hypothetical protein